jgi:hypothetical protein
MLGQLDDHAVRRELMASEDGEERAAAELRCFERGWGEVDRQELIGRQPVRAGHDRVDAGEVELRDMTARLGRGEELRRGGERRRRHRSDEALDTDDGSVRNGDDRLIDRLQAAIGDDLDHGRDGGAGLVVDLHRRFEHEDLGPSAALGGVQRRIGLREQLRRAEPELGKRREAAGKRDRLAVADAQRRLE